MNKTRSNKALRLFLLLSILIILLPVGVLIIWSFANRWPWPGLLPETWSLRALKEVFEPHNQLLPILLSSMLLSLTVAVLSALVATMTARALVVYDFYGKSIIDFLSMVPNLVPATVFAMGAHVLFIRMSLANTVSGVILVHLIYTLPYSVNIMKDLTSSVGVKMETQAYVLGASPLKSFIYISLPLLAPGIMASISMAYILSFSQYFLTLLIGGGRVKTFSILMVPFIAKGDRSISSVYALVFILSSLFVFVTIEKIIKKLTYSKKEGER